MTSLSSWSNVITMNTAEAFLQDIEHSIANAERQANSQPRKGMVVYLDKSTPIMVQYKSSEAFDNAKRVTSRKGQSSCLRNVLDGNGRLQ